MDPTPHHDEVEARFRALVAEADLPPPDRVERTADSLFFYWDAPRVAVAVDLEPDQLRAATSL